MQPRSILQIVSGFKPSVDGMGDFARILGGKLWERHQIESHYVAYRIPKTPLDTNEIYPSAISYAAEASLEAFSQAIAATLAKRHFDCILLHYGPYAYSSDGLPAHFVRMIAKIAAKTKFLIFFHELYAVGKPWKRAFWTNSAQRKSVGQLMDAATGGFTSNSKYMQQLAVFNKKSISITKIPIFSNIGEPKSLRPLSQRSRQLIVFGQLPTRIKLYRDHGKTLEDVCRKLEIESVMDVGSGKSEQIPQQLAGAQVQSTGWMEDSQLSALIADSIAGIVVYWPDVWEKSGVMAAYQAHALLPILVELDRRRFPAPPFVPYVLAKDVAKLAVGSDHRVKDEVIQGIADAALKHYRQYQGVDHCSDVIAEAAISGLNQRLP